MGKRKKRSCLCDCVAANDWRLNAVAPSCCYTIYKSLYFTRSGSHWLAAARSANRPLRSPCDTKNMNGNELLRAHFPIIFCGTRPVPAFLFSFVHEDTRASAPRHSCPRTKEREIGTGTEIGEALTPFSYRLIRMALERFPLCGANFLLL